MNIEEIKNTIEERNIEFRVWDKKKSQFSKQITTFKFNRDGKINLVVYLEKPNKTREIFDAEKVYCNEFALMQYTGFTDKNGKKIFEGDIVMTRYGGGTGIKQGTKYTVQIFETFDTCTCPAFKYSGETRCKHTVKMRKRFVPQQPKMIRFITRKNG